MDGIWAPSRWKHIRMATGVIIMFFIVFYVCPCSVIGSVIYAYITFGEKTPSPSQGATSGSDDKRQFSVV